MIGWVATVTPAGQTPREVIVFCRDIREATKRVRATYPSMQALIRWRRGRMGERAKLLVDGWVAK